MAYYSAYMMYSRHSSLVQLFGDRSDGIRSGLDDDGSYMEICGGVSFESRVAHIKIIVINTSFHTCIFYVSEDLSVQSCNVLSSVGQLFNKHDKP
jgi:hypothetical protein